MAEPFNNDDAHTQARHAVVVLAAGRSSRLGQAKQTLLIDGLSLEQRALTLALQTRPSQVVLARAQQDNRPLPELGSTPVTLVHPAPGGMGLSLKAAAEAFDEHIDGFLILTVDLPHLDLNHLQALLSLWRTRTALPVASAYADTVGMPAILPRSWRGRLRELSADQGARQWLRESPDLATVRNPKLAFDIDTPADLLRWRAGDLSP